MYLYRLQLGAVDAWSRFHNKKIPTMYCVAKSKDDAQEIVSRNLTSELKIVKVIKLGNAASGVVFISGE